ncbi:MAG TPA: SH3 domain-containing protein [Caldilineaceae bacterium]|nr:SH3 domain-containing protein [Caldilineaceae bacterium]
MADPITKSDRLTQPNRIPTSASPAAPQPAETPATDSIARRRARSLFWPGFVAGFLLISMVSCGGVVMATGVTRINLADLQDDRVAWAPPPVTPTPEAQQPSGDEAEEGIVIEEGGLYAPGDLVRNITSSRVNIRAVPGYLGKPEGDVIAQVLPGESMEILGGRAVADNLTWWRIRYAPPGGGLVEGWVAEATASGVQILGR